MQFLGLDAQLPELTARDSQTARSNRTHYARLDHARCGRSIPEGQRRSGVHVLRTVAQSMIRNIAPAMVTAMFMHWTGGQHRAPQPRRANMTGPVR